MKIAIISWGSLINSGIQRGLSVYTDFKKGGPSLPVEFSRISQTGQRSGCLTLVLDEENGRSVPTQYAESMYQNLDTALANLREVENIRPEFKYTIGYVNLRNGKEREWARKNHPMSCDVIKNWAHVNQFDAVIWTSLLPNFKKILNIPFSVDTAIQYLNHCSTDVKSNAFEYIRNSPIDVQTPFRIAFTAQLTSETNRPSQLSHGESVLMRFINRVRHSR